MEIAHGRERVDWRGRSYITITPYEVRWWYTLKMAIIRIPTGVI
jgi:hypothetical protein